ARRPRCRRCGGARAEAHDRHPARCAVKRHVRLLALIAALLCVPTARADLLSVTLLSGVTTTGPSAAISAASPPLCGERWTYQLHFTGRVYAAQAVLEASLDGGTTWTTLHVF